MSAKEQSLLEALEGQAAEQGIEIVAIEVVGSKKAPTIRVYIDSPQGVGFDELASSQAWINETMDKIDPFPGAYTLEVSSPGIDRPLRTLEHFRRFIGETAMIQTSSPLSGRSKWTGTIQKVSETSVFLETEDTVQEIQLEEMKRARLKGAVDFSS